jgi:hypothetical protein
MFRKIHILTLALLAAAVAAPIGQATDDPLALSILRDRAGASIADARSKPVDPLAVSMLRGRSWSASRIYDWTQGACSDQVKPSSCYLSTAQARVASKRLAESMGGPRPTPTPAAEVVTPAVDRIVDDSFRDPTPIVTPAGDRIVDDSFRDASPVAEVVSSSAFDWHDALIGAVVTAGILLVGAGGALALYRRRELAH